MSHLNELPTLHNKPMSLFECFQKFLKALEEVLKDRARSGD